MKGSCTLEQGKLNTLMNKIQRLHSSEASKGPLIEMGWKPGNHVLKSSGRLFSSSHPLTPGMIGASDKLICQVSAAACVAGHQR